MHRHRQPATETMKRIFDLLICKPSYPTEIHNKTGLHRNTVNDAFNFLVQNGLVLKARNGQRVLYSLVRAEEKWYVPWIKLVRPKEELSTHKEIRRQMSKGLLRKELDHRISNLRERFGKLVEAPLNDELIDAIIELHKNVPHRLLLNNIEKPFCLECLNSTKLFFPMFLIQDANEFCCPNCGISIPRLSTETNRPTENPEEGNRRELFYSEAKKKEPYTEIERLLKKYEEGKIRKRKIVKKSYAAK
jgi:DNA-binding transcriptional regulator YhcF (GntR family)